MLNAVIRFALRQQAVVLAAALAMVVYGAFQIARMPIDVFPNLNRPRVVVVTEAPGMSPEEVERLITLPLETVLSGASHVVTVRSSSGSSICVVYVDFDWGTDIYNDRQVVMERLQMARDRLPPGIEPHLAPVSSIMGQIQMLAMWSEDPQVDPMELRTQAEWIVRQRLLTIPGISQVFVMGGQRKQFQVLVDPGALLAYDVTLAEVKQAVEQSNRNAVGGFLDEQGANEFLVRTLGRVQSVEDLEKLMIKLRHGRPVLLQHVARVVEGPEPKRGDSAAFVRSAGGAFQGGPAVVLTISKQPDADTRRVSDDILQAVEEMERTLPGVHIEPELYSQRKFIDRAIDNVVEAMLDGSLLVVLVLFLFLLNFRTTLITLTAIPLSLVTTAIVFAIFDLSINTMTLGGLAVAMGELVDDAIVDVENIFRRLRENRRRSPPEHPLRVVFQASVEIRSSIVFGTILVVLVFVPLFALSGMEGRLFTPLGIAYIVSILASLAVSLTVTPVLSYWILARRDVWPWVAPLLAAGLALGATFWLAPRAGHLVGLSHLPLLEDTWSLALPLPGRPQPLRLDIPGALAVSLLLAPALWALIARLDRPLEQPGDGPLLGRLKDLAAILIRASLRFPRSILLGGALAVVAAAWMATDLPRDFLPPFNEGAVQLNVLLRPGTSLSRSNAIVGQVERRLQRIEAVQSIVRRTGRAELDEHAEGVNVSELILTIDPDADRQSILAEIRQAMDEVPGVVTTAEQPIAHLISHMLSGIKAQIGIKVYGDNLDELRQTALRIRQAIADVPGLTDLMVEPQVTIPQLHIELDRDQLALHGLRPEHVNDLVQTAMQGEIVSSVLAGQRTFDLLVRLDEPYREDLQQLRRLAIPIPSGGTIPLETVARIYESRGPNTIHREQVQRRIVIQSNVAGRGLVDVVEEIQARLAPIEAQLPAGYRVEYGGQFESQESASRTIGLLSLVAWVGIFLVLYILFRSANFALQVMAALPMAFIGSVAALVLTDQSLTIASLVGFISLGGIASRNGILLLNHYVHLVQHEGEGWTKEMLVRAGQERLAPVLMTGLTTGVGLLPLTLAAGEPGKEILYPVATVITGGLISSTLLEFLVRPALLWTVGRKAGEQIVRAAQDAPWEAGSPGEQPPLRQVLEPIRPGGD